MTFFTKVFQNFQNIDDFYHNFRDYRVTNDLHNINELSRLP